MAMDKKAKENLRVKFEEKFDKATSTVIAQYSGLTVAELTELRKGLRKVNAEFKVLKNRVAKKAVQGKKNEALAKDLKGPIGVVFIYGDPAPVAKTLIEFEKSKELFKIHNGVMDGQSITPANLKMISDLPSKEVLLGQIVGLLVAPHRQILGILTAVPRNLVQVINALKDKKA